MSKTLVLSGFAALLLALSFPAAAQNAPLSEVPAGGAAGAAAAAAAKAVPVGSYNLGVRPINLRPRYYVGGQQQAENAPAPAADTNAGRRSFPVDKPTSAASYNQRLVNAQLSQQRRRESVIPSPFPDNF